MDKPCEQRVRELPPDAGELPADSTELLLIKDQGRASEKTRGVRGIFNEGGGPPFNWFGG